MLSAQLYKQRQRKFFLSSLSLGAGGREQSVIQRGTSSTSKAVSRKCENNNSSGVGGGDSLLCLVLVKANKQQRNSSNGEETKITILGGNLKK